MLITLKASPPAINAGIDDVPTCDQVFPPANRPTVGNHLNSRVVYVYCTYIDFHTWEPGPPYTYTSSGYLDSSFMCGGSNILTGAWKPPSNSTKVSTLVGMDLLLNFSSSSMLSSNINTREWSSVFLNEDSGMF